MRLRLMLALCALVLLGASAVQAQQPTHINPGSVPEPATVVLFATGLGAAVWLRRRRSR